jgi:c-di-GMP-binding flagellar brake protein YcgR
MKPKELEVEMKKVQKSKKKTLIPVVQANRRREWRFDLPLSTMIEGKLPHGEKFKESTTIENISATGAYFCMDSGVVVGSKLNLMIDIPSQLTGGKEVKINLGGITVRLEEPDKKGKKQGVAIRFSKDFKFIGPSKKKKST